MQTLFKLGYSLTVGILLVLFVILGTRTFYDEPEETYGSYEDYVDERADYHRNVFIMASVLGVAGIAAGLYLSGEWRRCRWGCCWAGWGW